MEKSVYWENYSHKAKEQGLGLKDIAEKSGISYNTIINWRSKNVVPRIEEAKKMAEAVGSTIDEAFFGERPAPTVVNEGYETRLLRNIMEKSPDLYHFLIATYGYAGAMAEEISPKKEENSVSRA